MVISHKGDCEWTGGGWGGAGSLTTREQRREKIRLAERTSRENYQNIVRARYSLPRIIGDASLRGIFHLDASYTRTYCRVRSHALTWYLPLLRAHACVSIHIYKHTHVHTCVSRRDKSATPSFPSFLRFLFRWYVCDFSSLFLVLLRASNEFAYSREIRSFRILRGASL